jgi:signal recognition particle subunit SRP54
LTFGSDSKHSKVAMAKDFTLDDLRRQLDQVEKMGMKDHLGRVPGLSAMVPDEEDRDLAFRRIRQMLDAMTDEERSNPDLITSSSLSRIAASSGTHPQDVETFLAQFHQVRALMRQMAGMSFWQWLKMVFGFRKFPGQEGEPN